MFKTAMKNVGAKEVSNAPANCVATSHKLGGWQ